jgi:heterogeneous nuclear ribonucleoprotein F/H
VQNKIYLSIVVFFQVFASKRSEMEHVTGMRGGKAGANGAGGGGGAVSAVGNDDGIVRLRGLPFGCTKEEIANFFLGLILRDYFKYLCTI